MHIPTPHLRRNEKRKASIDLEKEQASTKKTFDNKAKSRSPEAKKLKQTKPISKLKKKKSEIPENPHPEFNTSPSTSWSVPTSPPPPTSSPPPKSSTRQPSEPATETEKEHDTETTTPRRSSRLKNSMRNVSSAWYKARPYVERINGTIMPLEHQGMKTYYQKDGVNAE